ncbi:MAG: glycosyltransferase family 9 protein [Ignavibacteriota bacterium]
MASVIKSFTPDCEVIFLVRNYTAPLLALAQDVDNVLIYDPEFSLAKTIALLRASKPDAIFFFGSKFKLTLAAFLARIPLRVGRAYWWYSFLYNRRIREHRKIAEYNEAEYNVRMLRAIGIESPVVPLPLLDHSKLLMQRPNESGYIVFHLTTGGSAGAWSEEKFTQLALLVKQEFDQPIILTGTTDEHEFLFRIAERMKLRSVNVHIHTTKTLLELAAVLESANFVISGSTGPGHLAAALGTSTIGIFPGVRSLSKERWGFRGKKVINLSPNIRPKAECPQCDSCDCLKEITPEEVMASMQILNSKK